MVRNPIIVLVLSGLSTLVLVVSACGNGEERSLDERAQAIDKSLICPVCPGETINQSQVQLARDMRVIVREKLGEGQDREQIVEFFVQRYGEGVLAAPSKSGFNLVVWVVPPVGGAAAIVLLVLVLRAMRRPEEVSALLDGQVGDAQSEGDLETYLPLVDQELRTVREGSSEPERQG